MRLEKRHKNQNVLLSDFFKNFIVICDQINTCSWVVVHAACWLATPWGCTITKQMDSLPLQCIQNIWCIQAGQAHGQTQTTAFVWGCTQGHCVFWRRGVSLNEKHTERHDIEQILTEIIVFMPFQIPHTFNHCSSELSVHISVHRVSFRIAAPVHFFSNTYRHAVAHKHFGNNNLTYRQNTLVF